MLLDFIETTVNKKLSDSERNLVIHGADEVDIVRSGLDDTMTNACAETRKSAMEKVYISLLLSSSSLPPLHPPLNTPSMPREGFHAFTAVLFTE